ncbi:MAG: hypothetical protein IJ894_05050, partial [Bacteroidales bacterium]|nr:hypothetical protein [Bacteroidales bacterium]
LAEGEAVVRSVKPYVDLSLRTARVAVERIKANIFWPARADENGELHDEVVSFFEAVARVNNGISPINKELNSNQGWKFLFTMKQNEYFVFPNEETGFNPHEMDLTDPNNYASISPNLFRVQTMSKVKAGNSFVRDYIFRHHLETTVSKNDALRNITYKQFKSVAFAKNIVKVRINHIGQIVAVGEY